VAGDFNQDLASKHYYWSATAREALRKALKVADLRALTAEPNDPVEKASDGKRRCIDHICVSREMEPLGPVSAWSPTLDGTEVSDHYGVKVVIDVS
jgi:endonuclease/exonuclease/phosphatase family metal-dependent hydrolase